MYQKQIENISLSLMFRDKNLQIFLQLDLRQFNGFVLSLPAL